MTTEIRKDPRKNFVPRFLPWLLAVAMLVVYWFTLNRWVSPFNLNSVAKVSGWTWQPELANPLFFLATYPFRWLPTAQIPLALNFFAAVCAALTLGLLARSVALLPQDRTDAQRKREQGEFAILTTGSAWLPPLLAVAVCGLQLTFWEHATNFTGEMLDLLLFAFVIWSLLEYRLDERKGRLYLAAFVYGAGMAENWAMVGFLPVFIAAIIWIRGRDFFNPRFLKRTVLCGLIGMLFYLLLPLIAVVSAKMPVTFWQALKYNLTLQKYVFSVFPHDLTELPLLILPAAAFVIAIRWSSSFGDSSRIGAALANFMVYSMYAFLLVVCLWTALDPVFSPRQKGLGLPFLTFYYLGALSVGYYSGYFLLVFGKKALTRARVPPPVSFQFLHPFIFAGVFVLAALVITGLVYKNAPLIRRVNDDTLLKYASLVEENLPRGGGILLSDDSQRLLLVQAALARDSRAKDFVPLDTYTLEYAAYHKFLHRQFPLKWPDTVSAAEITNGVGPLHLFGLLATLAKTNELYYLHPSFGYFFEQFYLEPHGLAYKMKLLPGDTLLPPPPNKNQIAENEAFWSRAESQTFSSLEQEVKPPDIFAARTHFERQLTYLYDATEQNPNALLAGTYYSRALDFWGVALQRAGELEKAAAHFEWALKLNPDNIAAQINLQFNQTLRSGRTAPVEPSKVTRDQFGKYHNWTETFNANGPFDEPSFCFKEGILFAKDNMFTRQAIAAFNRVHELDPDNLTTRLWLAELYLLSRLPDRALEALQEPLQQPKKFSLTDSNSVELNFLAAAAYLQKTDYARGTQLLELEMNRHPDDNNFLAVATEAYMSHGLFTNALAVIDRGLKMTPDDPAWLSKKGYVCIQVHAYDDAVAALTRVLATQTNNPYALFNRATAYLNSDRLDAARVDYLQLGKTFTNSFQVAYGLGEIAWRKHETNEAISNFKIYLADANTNTAEATNVILRLRELEGHSP